MIKKIKNDSGITLVALSITIIVLLILSTVAVSSGKKAIENSRLTTFTAEMKVMQSEVNLLYDKWKNEEKIKFGDEEKEITNIGNTITDEQKNRYDSLNLTNDYKLYDANVIEKLGIEGIEGTYFVNIKDRKVISVEGLSYGGKKYYTLDALPEGLYNVDYEGNSTGSAPTFESKVEYVGESKWRITIYNISYEGNIKKWNFAYKLDGENEWSTSKESSFIVNKKGIYKVKLVNNWNNENTEDGTDVVVNPGAPDLETEIFAKTSTINGGEASAINPTIPAGFKPVNVTKEQSATPATWGDGTSAPSEQSVKNGLVITDGTNEFVWIPVENIDEMAREIDENNDNNGNKKYRGVLYNFNSDKKQNSEIAWSTDSTSNREPANLSTTYDSASNVSGWTETLYQEEYDKMVKQVEKYHGFYVGRYEMSLNSEGEAQSKGEVTSANASESKNKYWYGLYTKAKTYAPDTQENTKSVVSSMIWGSQYDAMMRWMQNNGVDVTEKPTDTPSATLQNAERNKENTTGGENNKDVINNVYDILGNRLEWTQEANYPGYRVLRGGNYGDADSPSGRSRRTNPSSASTYHGSRFTLYIK